MRPVHKAGLGPGRAEMLGGWLRDMLTQLRPNNGYSPHQEEYSPKQVLARVCSPSRMLGCLISCPPQPARSGREGRCLSQGGLGPWLGGRLRIPARCLGPWRRPSQILGVQGIGAGQDFLGPGRGVQNTAGHSGQQLVVCQSKWGYMLTQTQPCLPVHDLY